MAPKAKPMFPAMHLKSRSSKLTWPMGATWIYLQWWPGFLVNINPIILILELDSGVLWCKIKHDDGLYWHANLTDNQFQVWNSLPVNYHLAYSIHEGDSIYPVACCQVLVVKIFNRHAAVKDLWLAWKPKSLSYFLFTLEWHSYFLFFFLIFTCH